MLNHSRLVRFGQSSLKHLLFIVFAFSILTGKTQSTYWVFFTDKDGVSFYPEKYFDQKALDRRAKLGIDPNHFTDRPVKQVYLDEINRLVDSTIYPTRWFNGVSVIASTEQIKVIQYLPFVKTVRFISSRLVISNEEELNSSQYELSNFDKALLRFQTSRMQADSFWQKGFRGEGIRIAIFDVGFPGVEVHPVFKHLRDNNKIINTKDFRRKSKNVYHHQWHGTAVLSCIAGILDGVPMGLATEAEFLLARTEHFIFEPKREEVHWLAAVEWADKNGADIISSSLGYTKSRYEVHDMNGETSLISRAANRAASKGILVLNAAGNEGNKNWNYLCTPADADSVLTVGGTDPETDIHVEFSSYGPTADNRLKPNVVALGEAVTAITSRIIVNSGTSFSTPLVAGFAACAWQTNRNLTNMELFKEIERSGHLHPYFDYAHGYGIPQASYFTRDKIKILQPTFSLAEIEGYLTVHIDSSFLPVDDKILYLFYHIRKNNEFIRKYAVIRVDGAEPLSISITDLRPNETLMIHFEGYTITFNQAE